MRRVALALALLVTPASVAAQDEGAEEVIVTGSRIDRDDDDDDGDVPAIGLRRVADFAVQTVTVTGDTRDMARRRDEIYATVRNAVERAGAAGGIDLAVGALVVQPLTLANYRELGLAGDSRPDSERATFLIKTSLQGGGSAKAALDRIDAFIKAVPTVGRAEIGRTGELTLSVVSPNQYRRTIVDLVGADARATAASIGAGYAVTASGLDRPVRWTRANLTEVFLYVPYSYQVVPLPR